MVFAVFGSGQRGWQGYPTRMPSNMAMRMMVVSLERSIAPSHIDGYPDSLQTLLPNSGTRHRRTPVLPLLLSHGSSPGHGIRRGIHFTRILAFSTIRIHRTVSAPMKRDR